jgi:nicotinamide-nucleotide amidase
VEFTILAGRAQVDFHVRVTDKTRARAAARLQGVRRRVLAAVGEYVFGEGADTLESALGRALLDRGWTLAVAESCTGGLVGGRLTGVAGSSKWFKGGVIAYDNEVKVNLLGVSRETLKKHGAVSLECAREMAEGARRAAGAEIGVAVTGVAGPGGGTKAKPVGLVCLAVAGPGQGKALAFQRRMGEGRALIRERSAATALTLALRRLRKSARGSA